MADELTKLGSTSPFIGAESALLLLQYSIVSTIWQGATATHTRVWDMVQTGLFIHCLLPAHDKKKLISNLLALNKAGIRVVIRILTLHNGLMISCTG